MADDIVTRLRRITAKPLGMVIDPPPHPLCQEAADGIERLTEWRRNALLALDKREAEIARLRAVLDAVDDLHSPRLAHDTCLACDHDWPCPTQRALHHEEARRG